MAISTNRAMHVTAPVTVGTAAQLVTATSTLGPNDAGRLFYDTDEAIAGGIGWKVWNGDALDTDYTYVTQATLLSGEDQDNDVIKVEHQYNYQVVPVTTQTTLGPTGASGDFLHKILATDATTVIVVKDDTVTVFTWTRSAGDPVELELNLLSAAGVWSLTCTTAGCTAVGRFTA